MKLKRPVLRYYGGKWRLAPWLLSVFPKHRIYVEPFGGGASVLMQKQPCFAEVYNDLNHEVVNVFRVLRDPVTSQELCRLIALTPFSRDDFKESYLQTSDPVEAARRTIIRSFMGFGSSALETPRGMRTRASIWGHTGFRKDASRSGTTPAHDWQNYPLHIKAFCERLSGVVIENKPAFEVVKNHDRKDTLFYCDPPYLQSTRSSPRHEYRFEMTEEDHVELAQVLHSVKGMVVISGYPSNPYLERSTTNGLPSFIKRTFAGSRTQNTKSPVLILNIASFTIAVFTRAGTALSVRTLPMAGERKLRLPG